MAAPNPNVDVNALVDGLNAIHGGIGAIIPLVHPLVNLLNAVSKYISNSSPCILMTNISRKFLERCYEPRNLRDCS